MRFFIFIVVLAAALGSATVFYLDALQRNAPTEAPKGPSRLDLLRAEAKKGQPKALYALAEKYRLGQGIGRDLQAALVFHEQAAKKGYAPSQLAVGRMYDKGEGTREDPSRAARWYNLAAGSGNLADAQYALGDYYALGRGVPQDYGRAQDLFHKAARLGHPVAQYRVASQYEHGWGVRASKVEAYKFYTLSLSDEARVLAANSKYKARAAIKRLEAKMTKFDKRRAREALEAWKTRR